MLEIVSIEEARSGDRLYFGKGFDCVLILRAQYIAGGLFSAQETPLEHWRSCVVAILPAHIPLMGAKYQVQGRGRQ